LTDAKTKTKQLIDISQNRRYSTFNIIDLFKFQFHNPDRKFEFDEVFDYIADLMYLFSPTEMSQRIRETYDFVNLYSPDEIRYIDSQIQIGDYSRYKLTAKFFSLTADIHYYGIMRQKFKDISSLQPSIEHLRQAMLVVFYFKFHRYYHTNDKLTKKMMERLWMNDNISSEEIKKYKKYLDKFLICLERTLKEYMHKVYSVIFSAIHELIWEAVEVKYTGYSHFDEYTKVTRKQLKMILEGTKRTI
jgi:hypothetical protein